jgi:8-oxo-dGTP pyrophosphatase MutT (NUDIX family)
MRRMSFMARWLRRRASLHAFPLSVGVRALVEDEDGSILLVRHTYVGGWHFPGGGVDPGESAAEAVDRELGEEAGLSLSAEPQLCGVYLNRSMSARDHVLFFRCHSLRRIRDFKPNYEIADARFFARASLPDDLSRGSRRRLDEIATGSPPSRYW